MIWELSVTTEELGIKIREARERGPSCLTEQVTVLAAA